MAKSQRTIESVSSQQNQTETTSQSDLDWNAPKKLRTRRQEWRFMGKYNLICGIQPHNPGNSTPRSAVQ
ncbi:MAG TPA: hypothetical protein VMI06_03885 [Terriglobia bacterium]|nr:hypothetical protein [Terriglobia bacterium]